MKTIKNNWRLNKMSRFLRKKTANTYYKPIIQGTNKQVGVKWYLRGRATRQRSAVW